MKNFCRLLLPALLFLALPVTVPGQVLTKDGDPVMNVVDPAAAAPTGKTKAKAPHLAAGQQVRLLEEKDGVALVALDASEPGAGLADRFSYRLPMTALRPVPGKTHTTPPDWLPAPAPAGTEDRDVVAYVKGKGVVVLSGRAAPRSLVQGDGPWSSQPAVSPDGAFLVYSPAKGTGNELVALDGKAAPRRFGQTKEQTERKAFSPDGTRLAWRVGSDIMLLDLRTAQAKPQTLLRGLASGGELQGFTSDSQAVVVSDGQSVSWIGLDGKTLRKVSADSFGVGSEPTSSDAWVPNPANAQLLLIACATRGTDAYHSWANDVSGAIYIHDRTSGTNYRLTPIRLAATFPAWSRDGKRVYFTALPDTPPRGPHHLYRINADGTGLTDLGPGFGPSAGMRSE